VIDEFFNAKFVNGEVRGNWSMAEWLKRRWFGNAHTGTRNAYTTADSYKATRKEP
jgi:hypothetical protein